MASISISQYRGLSYMPDDLVQGTTAPTTYDAQISFNLIPANSATPWTKQEMVLFLTRAIELIEDGRYTAFATSGAV